MLKLYLERIVSIPTRAGARGSDNNCAYLTLIAILIIFSVILQTVINLIMLSIGEHGEQRGCG